MHESGQCDVLCLVIGSTQSSRSFREPLPLEWRLRLRVACLDALKRMIMQHETRKVPRIVVLDIPDLLYRDHAWVSLLRQRVAAALEQNTALEKWQPPHSMKLRSWRYWFHYPKQLQAVVPREPVSGERVELCQLPPALLNEERELREAVYTGGLLQTHCPSELLTVYQTWLGGTLWSACEAEYRVVQAYKREWLVAPYPPIFHAVDAIVHCQYPANGGDQTGCKPKSGGENKAENLMVDWVLMIRRGAAPGYGLWAIPGGYLEPHETRREGALRELLEETGLCLDISDNVMTGVIEKGNWVVDAPRRSSRGRILTTVFVFDLGTVETLPVVTGADDAAAAEWVQLTSVQAQNCFEDHCFLLSQAALRYNWRDQRSLVHDA